MFSLEHPSTSYKVCGQVGGDSNVCGRVSCYGGVEKIL